MEITPFDCFLAEVDYHKTDDLKPGSAPNGSTVHIQAAWKISEPEKFSGDWAFSVAEYPFWLPERDLKIIKPVDSNTYNDHTKTRP